MVVMMVAMLTVLVGVSAIAGTNDAWAPSGSMTLSVMNNNIHPTILFQKYDKPQALADLWINLPMGFSVEAMEYIGLDGGGFDSNKGDEMDLAV
jgi:hypothetical protein